MVLGKWFLVHGIGLVAAHVKVYIPMSVFLYSSIHLSHGVGELRLGGSSQEISSLMYLVLVHGCTWLEYILIRMVCWVFYPMTVFQDKFSCLLCIVILARSFNVSLCKCYYLFC